MSRRLGVALRLGLASLLLVGACSDDSGPVAGDGTGASPDTEAAGRGTAAAPTTEAPTTTAAPATTEAPSTTEAPGPARFDERGPYAVGVRTLSLGDRQAEVWYPVDPAAVEGQPTEVFDSLSVIPAQFQPIIPKELVGTIDTGAHRDAPPATDDAPYPVVVYSHGFGGYRQVATVLTTHLASWGYVVVSVDHLERGIAAQITGTVGGAPDQDVTDVRNALDTLAADGDLGPLADRDRAMITGHSAGAGTAARASLVLDDLDGLVSISGGLPVTVDAGSTNVRGVIPDGVDPGEHAFSIDAADATTVTVTTDEGAQTVPVDQVTVDGFGGRFTILAGPGTQLAPGQVTMTVEPPDKPMLVLIGERDATVSAARSEGLYEASANPDRWLVNIANAGHNSFTDPCARIRGLGGLASLTPILGEAQVARAEDGCTPDFVDPVLAQKVANHFMVAFARDLFGESLDPAALDEGALADLEGVTLADYRSG